MDLNSIGQMAARVEMGGKASAETKELARAVKALVEACRRQEQQLAELSQRLQSLTRGM